MTAHTAKKIALGVRVKNRLTIVGRKACSMSDLRIALVTTCKGRAFHIKQTLSQNMRDNASYQNAVFVVLDYDSPDDLAPYLCLAFSKEIASGRLVLYRYKNGGKPFHVSHAKNMAARCGILEGADILITVDADNYTGKDFVRFAAESFKEPGIFLVPDHLTIQAMPHGPGRPCRGFAGRLAVRQQEFIKAGGYDEYYDTWRGEDIDMNFRLERMGYSRRFIANGHLNCIPHSSDVRFKEYVHAKQYENMDEVKIMRARTETVVNYGKFGVGTVCRNFSDEPIELKPVPTRIFGIGMQRTATTSLHRALQILGYDSFHWGEGEAPKIWHEMQQHDRSHTLERFYALSDNPIPMLYRELDRAYPGSKFILTMRDEDSWIKSMARLWSYEHNPTRWVWDIYPFSNRLHTILYGQPEFNAERMVARYRRHNDEVMQYFGNRPQDLLVLDMRSQGPWHRLCEFLERPVPSVSYPNANRSAITPTIKY
jgi:hypothetical protein